MLGTGELLRRLAPLFALTEDPITLRARVRPLAGCLRVSLRVIVAALGEDSAAIGVESEGPSRSGGRIKVLPVAVVGVLPLRGLVTLVVLGIWRTRDSEEGMRGKSLAIGEGTERASNSYPLTWGVDAVVESDIRGSCAISSGKVLWNST